MNRLLYFVPFLAFLATFDFGHSLFHTVHFVFQERDLTRAAALLNGSPIFFGPEMTGGGNLPGPLYYFLLALPMSMGGDWTSIWYYMIGLTAGGAVIGWSYVRTGASAAAAAVWVILFASAANISRILQVFLNVSFIFPFSIATFAALLVGMTAKSEGARRNAYFAGALISGFAIQLHFSTVTFLLGFLLAQACNRWLGIKRLNLKHLLIGLGLFALPTLPYFLFFSGHSAGQTWGQEPFFSGEAQGALPSLLLLIEFALQSTPLELAVSLLNKIMESVPWILLPLFLSIWLVPVKGAKGDEYGRWLKPLLFLMAVAAIPFSYWTFATIGIRYSLMFTIAAIFLAAYLFSAIAQRPRRLEVYTFSTAALTVAAAGWFGHVSWDALQPRDYLRFALTLAAPLVLYLATEKSSLRKSGGILLALAVTAALSLTQKEFGRISYFYTEPKLMPVAGKWNEMWRSVYQNTGWSYREAMRRMYFINHHLERDGRMSFDSAIQSMTPSPMGVLPDGFIVSMSEPLRGYSLEQIKDWIAEQNIPQEIKEALKSGELKLSERYPTKFLLVPYTVNKPNLLPHFFHNNGQGYFASPEDELLMEVTEPEGVKVLKDGRLLYKWNECPSRHPFCNTGAVVRVEPNQVNSLRLTVEVIGSAISQVSPWISPTWTQRWLKPYVEVRCGGRDFRFKLAEAIGYSRNYSALPKHVLLWGNNSIVAPYTRDFIFPCGKSAAQIGIGREGSEVETLHEVKRLPATELSIHL